MELIDKIEDKAVEKAFEYLDVIMKPALSEVGGIIADQVKYWRFKNQIKILVKARLLQEKYNITPKIIPVKTIASILEYSSLEENETLQDMWSGLLASASNSMSIYDIHLILSSILKELSYHDALVIKYMWRIDRNALSNNQDVPSFKGDLYTQMLKELKQNENTSYLEELDNTEINSIIIDNLLRLNLIKNDAPFGGYNLFLSDLGRRLIDECEIIQY